MPRNEGFVSSLLDRQLREVQSPPQSFSLPSWARRQAEVDVECSTSESSDDLTPQRPTAEIYFDVVADVDNVFSTDNSSSTD